MRRCKRLVVGQMRRVQNFGVGCRRRCWRSRWRHHPIPGLDRRFRFVTSAAENSAPNFFRRNLDLRNRLDEYVDRVCSLKTENDWIYRFLFILKDNKEFNLFWLEFWIFDDRTRGNKSNTHTLRRKINHLKKFSINETHKRKKFCIQNVISNFFVPFIGRFPTNYPLIWVTLLELFE